MTAIALLACYIRLSDLLRPCMGPRTTPNVWWLLAVTAMTQWPPHSSHSPKCPDTLLHPVTDGQTTNLGTSPIPIHAHLWHTYVTISLISVIDDLRLNNNWKLNLGNRKLLTINQHMSIAGSNWVTSIFCTCCTFQIIKQCMHTRLLANILLQTVNQKHNLTKSWYIKIVIVLLSTLFFVKLEKS